MTTPLRIIPLPKTPAPPCPIPTYMPSGTAILVAPSNSGKTTWILNVLLREQFHLCLWYTHIFVFSPTLHMDESWDLAHHQYKPRKIKDKHTGKRRRSAELVLDDDYDDEKLAAIMDAQEETEPDKRGRVLVILDDLADTFKTKSNVLNRAFFKGRHSKVYLWISSQSYKAIPRSLRINSPFFIFWKVNDSELDRVADELATGSKDDFKRLFRQATREKYSFFTVDMKASEDDKYTSNFVKISA